MPGIANGTKGIANHLLFSFRAKGAQSKPDSVPFIHPDKIKRLARGEAIVVNKQNFLVQNMFIRKGALDLNKVLT